MTGAQPEQEAVAKEYASTLPMQKLAIRQRRGYPSFDLPQRLRL